MKLLQLQSLLISPCCPAALRMIVTAARVCDCMVLESKTQRDTNSGFAMTACKSYETRPALQLLCAAVILYPCLFPR